MLAWAGQTTSKEAEAAARSIDASGLAGLPQANRYAGIGGPVPADQQVPLLERIASILDRIAGQEGVTVQEVKL